MTGHNHNIHAGDALIAAAEHALIASGEQWTAMRAAVFTALAAQNRSFSAYDITETVSSALQKRIAANSVYRILDLFVRTNLARRIESANAFIVNSHPGCRHDCIFLICETCGQVVHIDDDALTGSLVAAAKLSGFADVRPVVELRGSCAQCASG
jgi:Fur family transcriptional regulator, zinc uptake regulator